MPIESYHGTVFGPQYEYQESGDHLTHWQKILIILFIPQNISLIQRYIMLYSWAWQTFCPMTISTYTVYSETLLMATLSLYWPLTLSLVPTAYRHDDYLKCDKPPLYIGQNFINGGCCRRAPLCMHEHCSSYV